MKTPFQHAQLIALKKLGLSDRAVAKQLGNIDHTTVNRIWCRYSLGLEFLTRKPGSGRHRALSLSDKHWASLLLARGLARTASDLQHRFFPHVSIDTVRHCLHELNLKVYKRRRVPYLSIKARARHWKWARVFSSWNKMNSPAKTYLGLNRFAPVPTSGGGLNRCKFTGQILTNFDQLKFRGSILTCPNLPHGLKLVETGQNPQPI
jgi:transposase